MSYNLWFNLVTTPFIILWPEIQDPDQKTLYYLLWLNEFFWILDILRKFFDKPKKSRSRDIYENAVNYMKGTLIFDVISTLP